ncbi:MAG TPA: hypothetical protein VGL55_13350 [Steroidobacteraceae bacterium]|jgi:hypothetical protein
MARSASWPAKLTIGILWLALPPLALAGGSVPNALTAPDGQHDFDFNVGTWKTHIRRLVHPLSGSKDWVWMGGTVVIRKVWGGRGQIEEVEADGQTGHFESLTLFLYNPQAHQWSVSFANSHEGKLAQPAIGRFSNGRGEFFDQETHLGRAILVRVVWADITQSSHRFEQAFSEDGGKSWETNFVAVLTRAADGVATSAEPLAALPAAQHDFDWQIGNWKIRMQRLQHPLSGSTTWTELDGNVAVRPLWNGRANLAEITSSGPSGNLEFLSLRLFDPESKQWSLHFASSGSGILSVPMVGQFEHGQGEFYDYEPVNRRMTLVRFRFGSITGGSNRDEQAFSVDGGKTWETNWVNRSTRIAQTGRDLRNAKPLTPS